MLNLYKSNSMENLMDAFVSMAAQVPEDPMAKEWVCIQSRGMKQWITIRMAKAFGICANMQYLFPRQMVDHILSCFIPPEETEENINADILFWYIMESIRDETCRDALGDITNYIGKDETGKKLTHLSLKIAGVFDDYQVYRPEWLMKWQEDPSGGMSDDPAVKWQAALWHHIAARKGFSHLAASTRCFLKDASLKNISFEKLPDRVSFFGISTLPPLFLQVLDKASSGMDINFFLLVPTPHFYFDIRSPKEMGRIGLREEKDPEALFYETTNPLLSSFGASGRAFHGALESFEYQEPLATTTDLFHDPAQESQTLLAVLKSDILNLVHRKKGGEYPPLPLVETDGSISIHACHSPMREAQVLKDLLLHQFEKDPELAPHDIIVMMPDIEMYAPFIESVFSLEETLPFSISDRRKRSESEAIDAFLKIAALRNARLEQKEVLDLLLSPSIAGKFKILPDEIGMMEKMACNTLTFWGRDGEHRKNLGLPGFEENTWQFGLDRLFMGMAMPEDHDMPVKDILPHASFEGLDLDILGKLSAFGYTLFACLDRFSGIKRMDKWCEDLKITAGALLDRNSLNGEDITFLFKKIDLLGETAETAGFTDPVPFDTVFSLLEQNLNQDILQGNFLAGGITFCNIMPMRAIPFKIVVQMGMDEKSFPRRMVSAGFDLIKKNPEKGDKNERDEDRYLFLEALLSARSTFIITYTGMSIRDNSPIPCSGLVSELMDTMNDSFTFPPEYEFHFFHPLHPFNPVYFDKQNRFYSFSGDNCRIAKAMGKVLPDEPGSIQIPLKKKEERGRLELTLDDLIRFFRHPVEWVMKKELGIKIQAPEEQAMDRESFVLSGLDAYTLGNILLDKHEQFSTFSDAYPVFKAMGCLPLGGKGRLEFEEIVKTATPLIDEMDKIISLRKLPVLSARVNLDGMQITSGFSNIREDGLYFLSYGKLNGARLLSAWISHLVLVLGTPEKYPKRTGVIGRDPKGRKPLLKQSFPPLEKETAEAVLTDLGRMFQNALEISPHDPSYAPPCFFCETAWQFAKGLSKKEFDQGRETVFTAMNRAKSYWSGGFYQSGEKENRYTALCFEKNDPFESVDTLFSSGFVENAIRVYRPLIENLETLP